MKYGLSKEAVLFMFLCETLTIIIDEVGHAKIFKCKKELTQRINNRKGMETGDPRVDICHEKLKVSMHVSQLVWMYFSNSVIPHNFEIHHIDENILNNSYDNLLCLHYADHRKFHKKQLFEEAPF